MGKIKVTKVRSTIKRPADQKRTMEALGLRKMNQSNELNDSPQIRGMIKKSKSLDKSRRIRWI